MMHTMYQYDYESPRERETRPEAQRERSNVEPLVNRFEQERPSEAKENRGAQEERRDEKLYENGDRAYQRDDGTQVIEYANKRKVELDKEGDILRSTQADGSNRVFSYELRNGKKELTGITDTKVTKDGEQAKTWTRHENPNGTLSNWFLCTDG